jgi:hypothetical protein
LGGSKGETSMSIKNLNIPEDLMEFCIFHEFEIDELNNQLISRVEHKFDFNDFTFLLAYGDGIKDSLTKILSDPEVYDEENSEIHNVALSSILRPHPLTKNHGAFDTLGIYEDDINDEEWCVFGGEAVLKGNYILYTDITLVPRSIEIIDILKN